MQLQIARQKKDETPQEFLDRCRSLAMKTVPKVEDPLLKKFHYDQETKEANIPIIFSYPNLVLSNLITPTLYDNYQQCPHFGNFTISLPPHIRRYQQLE
jgi:hypothetical protein